MFVSEEMRECFKLVRYLTYDKNKTIQPDYTIITLPDPNKVLACNVLQLIVCKLTTPHPIVILATYKEANNLAIPRRKEYFVNDLNEAYLRAINKQLHEMALKKSIEEDEVIIKREHEESLQRKLELY